MLRPVVAKRLYCNPHSWAASGILRRLAAGQVAAGWLGSNVSLAARDWAGLGSVVGIDRGIRHYLDQLHDAAEREGFGEQLLGNFNLSPRESKEFHIGKGSFIFSEIRTTSVLKNDVICKRTSRISEVQSQIKLIPVCGAPTTCNWILKVRQRAICSIQ